MVDTRALEGGDTWTYAGQTHTRHACSGTSLRLTMLPNGRVTQIEGGYAGLSKQIAGASAAMWREATTFLWQRIVSGTAHSTHELAFDRL